MDWLIWDGSFFFSKHWGCFSGKINNQVPYKIGYPQILFFIYNCEGLWDRLTLQKTYTGSFKPSDKSFALKIIDHLLKKSQLS